MVASVGEGRGVLQRQCLMGLVGPVDHCEAWMNSPEFDLKVWIEV